MSQSNWQQTVDSFGQEVASIAEKAGVLSKRFSMRRRQAELLKLGFLMYCLERQRRHLARVRGFASIRRNGRKLRQSLALGALGLIVSGIVSRDKLFAVEQGLSRFDAALQANGQATWGLALGKDLKVLPESDFAAAQGKVLVTWESLRDALKGLRAEALQGVELGSLDSVLTRLQRRTELVYLGTVAKATG